MSIPTEIKLQPFCNNDFYLIKSEPSYVVENTQYTCNWAPQNHRHLTRVGTPTASMLTHGLTLNSYHSCWYAPLGRENSDDVVTSLVALLWLATCRRQAYAWVALMPLAVKNKNAKYNEKNHTSIKHSLLAQANTIKCTNWWCSRCLKIHLFQTLLIIHRTSVDNTKI